MRMKGGSVVQNPPGSLREAMQDLHRLLRPGLGSFLQRLDLNRSMTSRRNRGTEGVTCRITGFSIFFWHAVIRATATQIGTLMSWDERKWQN
jgi:hypothetical protein